MNKTILFIGPPGAGKGTFAQKLIQDFNVCHISTGNIFRENIKGKTPVGLKALSFIKKGVLVPDEITDQMVLERLNKDDAKESSILLDGYPRNIHQAKKIVESLATIDKKLDLVIWLDAPSEILIKRIANRRLCNGCDKVYDILTMLPKLEGKCDLCNGDIYQRVDDTQNKVMARLESYNSLTRPLIELYHNQKILVKVNSLNGLKKSYNQIKKAIGVK